MSDQSNETINLLFCCNRNYAQHLCVALISVLANNPDFQFFVVVASNGDFGEDGDRIRKSLEIFPNVVLKFESFQPPPLLSLPTNFHYSTDTYTRLWVDTFFPNDVTRVLYLDADLIVVGDIAPLWRADLEGKLLGAVSIPGSTRCGFLSIPEAAGYFNSGALVIDLVQWRQTGAADEVLSYVAANPEKLIDADQDALNACFFARRHSLPSIYNVITPFYFQYHDVGLDEATLADIQHRAVVVHFNGASKPWSYMCRHPRTADYLRYLSMSDWRDFVPPDKTLLNMAKKFVAGLLSERLRRAIGR